LLIFFFFLGGGRFRPFGQKSNFGFGMEGCPSKLTTWRKRGWGGVWKELIFKKKSEVVCKIPSLPSSSCHVFPFSHFSNLDVIGAPLFAGASSNSPPPSSVSIKKCFPGLTVLTEEKYIAKGKTDPRVECSHLCNCFYILSISSQVDQNSALESRPNASLKISTKPQI